MLNLILFSGCICAISCVAAAILLILFVIDWIDIKHLDLVFKGFLAFAIVATASGVVAMVFSVIHLIT